MDKLVWVILIFLLIAGIFLYKVYFEEDLVKKELIKAEINITFFQVYLWLCGGIFFVILFLIFFEFSKKHTW
ncbi:MAG: hypothetical protein ABH811_00235 [archaeon]